MVHPAALAGSMATLASPLAGALGIFRRGYPWDLSELHRSLVMERVLLIEFAFDADYATPLASLAVRSARGGYEVFVVCEEKSPLRGLKGDVNLLILSEDGDLKPTLEDHVRLGRAIFGRSAGLLIYDSLTALTRMAGIRRAYLIIRSLLDLMGDEDRAIFVVFPWAHEYWEIGRFRALMTAVYTAFAGRFVRLGD
ncbi:MAG TPA: hypothetical protein ENG69_03405 [Candidatus Korarchaeota archaeon]|nr:hypothetical protein [Candidatus Korarchaeota archaeon]